MFRSALRALALLGSLGGAIAGGSALGPAMAAEGGEEALPHVDFHFSGPFGSFDRAAAQRGFQVYKEVCSACHSLRQLSYRNLSELGFSDAEVRAIAASVTVNDGPNDEGQMFDRPGRPSDRFRSPFPNEAAARAANNGAAPPDLSVITKARENGPQYIYALLNGYADPPAGMQIGPGMNFNRFFPGHQIAMAPPLREEGQVEYADGTKATVPQMAFDVVNFLQWASEPEMEARKRLGVRIILFLTILGGLAYATKRKIWANVPH
jgi:ubiquinol-cytochrome c reductase cytochrome c1 subunit